MKRLLLSPKAVADLEAIADYVAERNPRAATHLVQRFERVVHHVREFPGTGTTRPDISAEFRGLAVGNYLVLYRELDDAVEIVRFVHGARDLKSIR